MLHRLRQWFRDVVEFFSDWFLRFVELTGFDRAMAIAGSAFSALIPLLIVYGAIASKAGGKDFSDRLIDTFDLHGSAATSLQAAFAPPSEVQDEVQITGVLLLILSALSFTRALQRLYQIAFNQTKMGWRAARWGLSWLGLIIVFLTLRPLLLSTVHGGLDVAISIFLGFGLWLLTPFVLLAYRVPWRTLVPAAVLTGVSMSVFTASAAIWLPHTVSSSAAQYGPFGIAFAILGWLVGAGVVLVVCTAGGSLIAERMGLPLQEESAGTGSPASRARSDAA